MFSHEFSTENNNKVAYSIIYKGLLLAKADSMKHSFPFWGKLR